MRDDNRERARDETFWQKMTFSHLSFSRDERWERERGAGHILLWGRPQGVVYRKHCVVV